VTRLLIFLAIVALIVAVRWAAARRQARLEAAARQAAVGEDLVQDPQCLAYVPQSRAIPASVGGEALRFCSEACAERYRRAREG
jgi:hypothetical protein